MTTVREASRTWISLAVQEWLPREPQPDQLAEQLLLIAEGFDVPVEQVRAWIRTQAGKPEIRLRDFARWAQAWQEARRLEARKEDPAEGEHS